MIKFVEVPASPKSTSKRKLVCGVGINNAPYLVYKRDSNRRIIETCPYYKTWHSMINRCYSEKFLHRSPSYSGCEVCGEWLYFMNFRKWMQKQDWENKQLDKDILISGNKTYTPNACIFVEQKFNQLLAGQKRKTRGSLPVGVYLKKGSGRYAAQMNNGGRLLHLGYFDSLGEAAATYLAHKSKRIELIANSHNEPLKTALLRIAGEVKRGEYYD